MTQFGTARMRSHWECRNQREGRPEAADKSAASESACWENRGAKRASSRRQNEGRTWASNGVEETEPRTEPDGTRMVYVDAGGPGETRRDLIWSVAKAHVSAGALIERSCCVGTAPDGIDSPQRVEHVFPSRPKKCRCRPTSLPCNLGVERGPQQSGTERLQEHSLNQKA